MILYKSSNDEEVTRAGAAYRVNPERYFLVQEQGWYVLVREGICGPYQTKEKAQMFIHRMIDCLGNDNHWCLRVITR